MIITLWKLLLKTLWKSFTDKSDTSIDLNLYSNPWFHTLASDFDISKKTPRVSRPAIAAKEAFMSFAIVRSWLVQESFGRKPDWWSDKNLLFLRKLKRRSNINFSNSLQNIGSREIGWYFCTKFFWFFMNWTNVSYFPYIWKCSKQNSILKNDSDRF